DDDVGGAGEVCAVVDRVGSVAGDVAAAVHPDDHGQLRGRGCRPPDVQVQAILGTDRLAERRADRGVVLVVQTGAIEAARLRARVAELLRESGRRPRVGVHWRLPPQFADGRLGVWHTLPNVRTIRR